LTVGHTREKIYTFYIYNHTINIKFFKISYKGCYKKKRFSCVC